MKKKTKTMREHMRELSRRGVEARRAKRAAQLVSRAIFPLEGEVTVAAKDAAERWLTTQDWVSDVRESERRYAEACRSGWEGLIAKRAEAPYVPGRSRDWLKLKCVLEQEFVKDPKQTITQLLGKATVTRFARIAIAE